MGIPIQAIGKTNKDKSVFELIDDIVLLNEAWIAIGHNEGANMHNVSTTLRIRPEEVKAVASKLVNNVDNYTAVAYLPASDVVYPQAPFQEISDLHSASHSYTNTLSQYDQYVNFEKTD